MLNWKLRNAMTFTIAHSPDSDDAYMMAPLALGWMDPEGFDIEFIRKDIEQLNAEATETRYDVTAISFGAYPELRDRYDLRPIAESNIAPSTLIRDFTQPTDGLYRVGFYWAQRKIAR